MSWSDNVFVFSIIGLSQLRHEIKENHLLMPIKSLCSTETASKKILFVCFQLAQPLLSILNSYHFLSQVHHNALFQGIWSSKLKVIAKAKLTLSIPDLVTKIWNPVFEECCQLLDSVKSRSIKLKDVDRYFRELEGGYMQHHLINLLKAIEKCHGWTENSLAWVHGAMSHIKHYWSLCEQAEAACSVLGLRDTLKLTGDFKIIENVASKVTTTMKESSLNSIDERFIEAKSFLEEFIMDKTKLECLKKFAACVNLVEWIGKETKG